MAKGSEHYILLGLPYTIVDKLAGQRATTHITYATLSPDVMSF
jgi:hypothetical protein